MQDYQVIANQLCSFCTNNSAPSPLQESSAILPVHICLVPASNPSVPVVFSPWKYADAVNKSPLNCLFLVSWPEQIYYHSPKCPFQPQCSFWGCFHTFSDLGCGYKTGCYMPVFLLPILYMEIKISPPLSIPLGHLSLHSTPLHDFCFVDKNHR